MSSDLQEAKNRYRVDTPERVSVNVVVDSTCSRALLRSRGESRSPCETKVTKERP
ncbi:MAG: hypothetical protein IIB27_07095 [Chloroflexi bacterium]|nr:hypothetical protein [Chloroflexota bacterium]